ncbi:MAG: hypothetical protein JW795_12930 [Chitinivibrionales bacterium]|nr:hypothetical protein [Chitinivibrionales bacterium]
MKPFRVYLLKLYTPLFALSGRLLRRNAQPPASVRTILINRADRLGDAAISLPIIIGLSEKYAVTVVSSAYNDVVFKKAGLNTIQLTTLTPSLKESGWLRFIRQKLQYNFSKEKTGPVAYDLYLNFMGTPQTQLTIGKQYAFSAGITGALYGLRHDITVEGFEHKHYVDTLVAIVKACIPSFSFIPSTRSLDCLVETSESIRKYIPTGPFTVFHIGGTVTRLLKQDTMSTFLNSLTQTTILIDAPGQPELRKLKPLLHNHNLVMIEEDFTLFELMALTADPNCTHYIGYDSGNSHFLQMPVSCLIIFTVSNHRAWRPYTGNAWECTSLPSKTVLETSVLDKKLKAIVYRKTWCQPCNEMMCATAGCKNIDLSEAYRLFVQEMERSGD